MSGPDCGEAGHAEGRCGTAECLRGTNPQAAPEKRTGLEIRHTLTLRNGDTLTVILRPVVGEIPRAWEVFVNGGLLANGEESAVYRGQGCLKDAQKRAMAEVYSAAHEAGEPV